jgi:hypothetical protein
MRRISFCACIVALFAVLMPLNAATIVPVPIDEEFAASQVLYVMSSLSAESDLLGADLGFDPNAIFHYDGTFHLFTAPGADPLGDFTGTLAGTYSGDDIEIMFDGVMRTAASREITVNSSQTDKKGKETGSDSGTVTVEDDGTATIKIKIVHLVGGTDVTGSGLSYVKDKAAMTMTVAGDVDANGKNSLFRLVYHQDTKDFSSSITAYKSTGSLQEIPPTFPERRDFRLTFDAVPVPEPATFAGALAALTCCLAGRSTRRYRRRRSVLLTILASPQAHASGSGEKSSAT